MELYDSQQELVNSELEKKNHSSLNKDLILCNHCKRTSSNGIRCLGMCIEDNEY